MQDHPLARTFKQRAKLRFRFAQGALGSFALSVVYDAGTDEILAFRRKPQQADLGRDQPAIRLLLVQPFEDGHSARQSLIHFFASELSRATSARLEFWADGARSQLGQLFHGHAVK